VDAPSENRVSRRSSFNFFFAAGAVLAVLAAPVRAQIPMRPVDTLYVMLGGGVVGRIDARSVRGAGGPADMRPLVIARPRGTHIEYAFRPDSGFENVQVRLAEHPASPTGSTTLEGPQSLIVAADRIARLDARNKRLYDLIRAQLTATDVVMAAQRIKCEESHLFATYPESIATRLVDDADDLAINPIQDGKALERIDRALAGRSFSVGCDTLPSRSATSKPPSR
jgi:hypothetical protein